MITRHNELDKQLELSCQPELWRVYVEVESVFLIHIPRAGWNPWLQAQSIEKEYFPPGSSGS